MNTKQVKDFIKLGDEIKAYGNDMFLTVNYPVNVNDGYNRNGRCKSREEYRFNLVLRNDKYKRIKHWFFSDERFEAEAKAITKEFTMAQVAVCRKYWLKVRNETLPEPKWQRW